MTPIFGPGRRVPSPGDGQGMMKQSLSEHFSWQMWALSALLLAAVMLLCLSLGSANVSSAKIPLGDTLTALWNELWGLESPETLTRSVIIIRYRLARVLNVALIGAALSLCGAAMQGLLRNPLADGSTVGVSSGASLGAVLALALGVTLPGSPYGATMLMAMGFAFLSLLMILALAWALDRSLSTNSIILIGVIHTMFVSSLISLIISFAGERVKSITFWTLGSVSSATMDQAKLLALALLLCGGVILRCARELNAFAIGEENARHVGIHVKRVKLTILIAVSVLIGLCVSISGCIGFVGLVTPHMARMITGPNHRRLLPASLFAGAVFLLLADLASRTLFSPTELSIGVVTSLVGAAAFVVIFYRTRKKRGARC